MLLFNEIYSEKKKNDILLAPECIYCSLIRFYQVIDEINSNQLLFPISFLILFYLRVRKTNVYM